MAVPTFTDQIALGTDPIAPYVDQILGIGPTVFYRLDDAVGSSTAADGSGNGHAGTVHGGVTFGTAGLLPGDSDTCAAFNGSTGYISVSDLGDGQIGSAFSIVFVLKPADISATQACWSKDSGGAIYVTNHNSVDGCLEYAFVVGGSLQGIFVQGALQTALTYHVAVVDNGVDTVSIYINGALVASANRGGTGANSGAEYVGSLGGSSAFLHATLDEFALFSGIVLTADQIAQLYRARTVEPASQTTWTTFSGGIGPISITRGKQHELDQMQAGSCASTVRNTDRALDPTNTASPYYPNVLPLRRFRRRATINSTTYNVFSGYATRYPQTRVGPTYAEVPIQAIDGFEPLTQAIITGTFPQELSGARIARVLNLAAWSQADRNLDGGQTLVQAVTFQATDKKTALSHIQDVEQSEAGLFFIAGNGQATFIDRHGKLTSPYNTSQATFSDTPGGGEYGYQGIAVSYDRDQIWNDWTDTRTGGTAQNAQDAPSIQSYFRRSKSLTSLVTSDSESLYLVEWMLSLYKDPLFRVDSITLRPGNSTAFWQAILARELGDRITVKGSPPGGGPQFVKDCFIAQIDISTPKHAADTTITWQLVSADTINYLVLNDPAQGQLDSNAITW